MTNKSLVASNVIRRLLALDPSLTYSELGKYAGVSKQRAHQITNDHNLFKSGRWSDTSKACLGGCGKRLRFRAKTGWCRTCLNKTYAYEFRCGWCLGISVVTGKEASNRRSNLKKRKYRGIEFCCKTCSGRFYQREVRRKTEEV